MSPPLTCFVNTSDLFQNLFIQVCLRCFFFASNTIGRLQKNLSKGKREKPLSIRGDHGSRAWNDFKAGYTQERYSVQ